MGRMSFELFISKLTHQVDDNVDIDCSIYVEPVDSEGNALSEGFEIDASVSLTDAIEAFHSLSEAGDYEEGELMESHKTLSLMHSQVGSLLKVIENRLGLDQTQNRG